MVQWYVETGAVLPPQVVCATVAGVGPELRWVVTVGGQASLASAATSSYAAPRLFGIYAADLPAAGGSRHVVNGTDLGLASGDAFVRLFFDGVAVAVDGDELTTVLPATSELVTGRPGPDGVVVEAIEVGGPRAWGVGVGGERAGVDPSELSGRTVGRGCG